MIQHLLGHKRTLKFHDLASVGFRSDLVFTALISVYMHSAQCSGQCTCDMDGVQPTCILGSRAHTSRNRCAVSPCTGPWVPTALLLAHLALHDTRQDMRRAGDGTCGQGAGSVTGWWHEEHGRGHGDEERHCTQHQHQRSGRLV